jgi:hypothetical protein
MTFSHYFLTYGCYELNCVPSKKSYGEILALVPQNVTIFESKLYRCSQVKMKSLGWALIEYTWWVYLCERKIWTETDSGRRCHARVETEYGVILP